MTHEIDSIEKQQTQYYQQLAEHVEEVFWVSNKTLTEVHYVNPAFEKVWQRSCEYIYENPWAWVEAIHPEDVEAVHKIVEDELIGKQKAVVVSYRIVRPDGTQRWIEDRMHPLFDESGNVFRNVGIAKDVTHYKEIERSLLDSETKRRALEKSYRSNTINVMLASLAHDLNQPLSCITLYAENALNYAKNIARPADAKVVGDLESLLSQVDRMSDYIKAARAALQQSSLVKETFALDKMIEHVIEMLQHEIHQSKTSIVIGDAKQWPCLYGNRIQMEQALLNLFFNAIESMSDMPASVAKEIRVDCRIMNGSHCELAITDNGCGIAEDELENIFQALHTTKSGNLGMGLCLVHAIVESYGGSVSVESKINQGSCFKLRLPIASQEKDID